MTTTTDMNEHIGSDCLTLAVLTLVSVLSKTGMLSCIDSQLSSWILDYPSGT